MHRMGHAGVVLRTWKLTLLGIFLDALNALEAGNAWRVTWITEKPISTTKGKIHNWGIAGLGTMAGKSCVLTAYLFRRLKKRNPIRYRRFMENLVLHEVGHTLGVGHCPLERCIMADAVKLTEMNQPGMPLADTGIIDGPMDLFTALSPEAAAIKGRSESRLHGINSSF